MKSVTSVTERVTTVLQQMAQLQPLSKAQCRFLTVLLPALLVVRGKVNFVNLSRYCGLHERTLRRQFRAAFDWPLFNRLALAPVTAAGGAHIVALGASFVKKSGKKTYGLDRFFNGCLGRVQKGLEVSLVSLIDVATNTAYALSVRQTPPSGATPPGATMPPGETRMDFYLKHLQGVVEQGALPGSVRYGVFDGAFAKQKFVDGVCELGLQVVSKLRCDADLRHLYTGPQKKRGRRKLYDGKVDFTDLSRWHDAGAVEPHLHLYTVVAHHQSLRRVLRVVLLVCDKEPAKPRYVLLFSSDVALSAAEIVRFYKARFQMEFWFRDAKGWTGLEECQARDEKALHFHFNASLSAVNLAKLHAHQTRSEAPVQTHQRSVFSLASWKQRAFNEHLLETFMENLALEPSWVKTHPRYHYLCNYGVIST